MLFSSSGKLNDRSSHQRCSVKKVFLEISQNSQENTCARVSILIKLNFIKKETLAQVFSFDFCEISKNTFFTEHVWATASLMNWFYYYLSIYFYFWENLTKARYFSVSNLPEKKMQKKLDSIYIHFKESKKLGFNCRPSTKLLIFW